VTHHSLIAPHQIEPVSYTTVRWAVSSGGDKARLARVLIWARPKFFGILGISLVQNWNFYVLIYDKTEIFQSKIEIFV
jgi:hypothetical protein